MKKFEIRKASAEIRNRLDIAEGCAHAIDEDPVIINTYDSIEEAREAFTQAKLTSTINELSSPVGRIHLVEEFYIEENEYDEDGEWISGGDVFEFSPMTITVECGDESKSFSSMKNAVDYYEECVGGEFEPRLVY